MRPAQSRDPSSSPPRPHLVPSTLFFPPARPWGQPGGGLAPRVRGVEPLARRGDLSWAHKFGGEGGPSPSRCYFTALPEPPASPLPDARRDHPLSVARSPWPKVRTLELQNQDPARVPAMRGAGALRLPRAGAPRPPPPRPGPLPDLPPASPAPAGPAGRSGTSSGGGCPAPRGGGSGGGGGGPGPPPSSRGRVHRA